MQTFSDALWGKIKLDDPVLEELVASAPIQRLRGIEMAGASRYLFPERQSGTRFEHSLGVLHILQVLDASLEEQVAGLLHDVPHTAFSHTADTVFPSEEYDYHERFQHDIIMRSEIPAILARYQIDLRAALEPHTFPLLEQSLPDLCADRLDYSLRDLHAAGMVTDGELYTFVSHLVPTAQGIVINDTEAALSFSYLFQRANDAFWTGPDEAGAYWALAGAIKRALETGGFIDADLFSTDEEAMLKLRSLDDSLVQAYLRLLEPGTVFHQADEHSPFFVTHMKQRSVDPRVKEPSWESVRRLSEVSEEYARHLHEVRATRATHYRLWSPAIGPELKRAVNGRH
jgi:HD superfamily phosphohydrolase